MDKNNFKKLFIQSVDSEPKLSLGINSIDISKKKSQKEDSSVSDYSTHLFIYFCIITVIKIIKLS